MTNSLPIVLGTLGCLYPLLCLSLLTRSRHRAHVRAHSPNTQVVMCVGTVMVGLSILLDGIDDHGVGLACTAPVWLFNVGYTISVGIINNQLIRLYRIFGQFDGMRVRNLPDSLLFRNVLATIVPDLIILVVWTAEWDWQLIDDGSGIKECNNSMSHVFVPLLSTIKALAIAVCGFFVWKTRSVPREFLSYPQIVLTVSMVASLGAIWVFILPFVGISSSSLTLTAVVFKFIGSSVVLTFLVMYVLLLPGQTRSESTTGNTQARATIEMAAHGNTNGHATSITHSPGHISRPSGSSVGRRTPLGGGDALDSTRSLPSSHALSSSLPGGGHGNGVAGATATSHRLHFAMVENHHIRKSETMEFQGRLEDISIAMVIERLRELPNLKERDKDLHVTYRLAIDGVTMEPSEPLSMYPRATTGDTAIMVVRTIVPPPTPTLQPATDGNGKGNMALSVDANNNNDGVESVSIIAAPASPRAARGSITNSTNAPSVASPEIHLDVLSYTATQGSNGNGSNIAGRGSFASVNGITLNPSAPNEGAPAPPLSPVAAAAALVMAMTAASPNSGQNNHFTGTAMSTLPSSSSSSSPRGSGILLAALSISSSTNQLAALTVTGPTSSSPPSPPSPPLPVAANLPPMPPVPSSPSLQSSSHSPSHSNVVMIHRGSI